MVRSRMVEWQGKMVAQVNEVLCKGCGACVAACPAGAATQYGFTNDQVLAEIEGILDFAEAGRILSKEDVLPLRETA